MNFSVLSLAVTLTDVWQLVGWTMILFLAGGTVVLVIGSALRFVLRRANPSVRYCASLGVFAVVAATPIVMAGYLATNLPVLTQEARMTNPTRQRGELTTNDTKELLNAEVAKSAKTAGNPFAVATEITESTAQIEPINGRAHTAQSSIDFDSLLNLTADYLPWLWCVGTPLTFLLLATGLIGAERLRSSCQLLTDGPIRGACDELRAALGIGQQVGVAVCERIATPLLVGVVKPLILLPPAALCGWTTAELEMVLVHELAHVRRWDNAVNLAQRVVESLLFFHPAVWVVSGWVRRDREDCCDAVVVRHTAKPQAYAELLLALASHQPIAGLAATGMAHHPVASRIRRILKLEDEPMLVTRKGLFVGISTVVVAAILAFALPTTDAEESQASPLRKQGEITEETTKDTKEEKDLTTEDTESTEKNSKKDSVQYTVVYSLGDNDAEIKSWLKAIELAGECQVIKKDGKDMAVVTGTRAGHEKLSAMFESIRGEDRNSPFPTLEEQRAADLAYKLLGVELEKLTPEELERVKAKGYKGGLRVVNAMGIDQGRGAFPSQVINGDILVGLHAWPTESLTQITEILSRDDLDRLSPLKFYVVRQVQQFDGGFGMEMGGAAADPAAIGAWPDGVVTGRIQVDLDAWRTMQRGVEQDTHEKNQAASRNDNGASLALHSLHQQIEELKSQLPNISGVQRAAAEMQLKQLEEAKAQLAESQRQQNPFGGEQKTKALLYDGKTFDEWRSLWKTELKTEKRVECIKALAAFGRAGKGAEAAEAILDVAAEYDYGKFEGDSAQTLKAAISQVMGGSEGIPGQYWLPLLIERLKSDPDKWSSFGGWVLSDVQGKDLIPQLKQLAKDDALSADARGAALAGLAGQPEIADDVEAVAMLRESLRGDEPSIQVFNALRFNRLDLIPEQFELLFHRNKQIRDQVFGIARSGGTDGEAVLNKLLEALSDPARSKDREKVIVALYQLNGYYLNLPERRKPVTEKITEILVSGDSQLLPASLALMSSLTGNDERLVISELGNKISDERRKKLESAIEKAESLKSEARAGGMGGMGGGGMGGGGGMF